LRRSAPAPKKVNEINVRRFFAAVLRRSAVAPENSTISMCGGSAAAAVVCPYTTYRARRFPGGSRAFKKNRLSGAQAAGGSRMKDRQALRKNEMTRRCGREPPQWAKVPCKKKTMQTYDIVIYSVGCSGPGSSEMWVAVLEGKELTRDKAPIYAAARALLECGAAPTATLRMRHQGSPTISMTGVIGDLAKLTIVEGNNGPKVALWKPWLPRPLLAAE
jgi:hypothetical protein